MFGGVRKFIFERFLLNTIYRKNLRMWWLPILFSYVCKINNNPSVDNILINKLNLNLRKLYFVFSYN